MNRLGTGGVVLSVVGLVGYGIGVFAPYPGRSASITVVMLGLTLVGIHRLDVTEDTL